MRRTWCWCQTLHGLLDVPDVNSLRGKGKRWVTHWFAVSFYFPSNSSKTAKILNAMKSLSTLYVKCEMQYLTVSCSAAQHRSSPANAEPVRLELRNRMQCSNVIPAVSSELISLAERQDRFCLADCTDRAAIEPGTWASLSGAMRKCCQCWENCTDLNGARSHCLLDQLSQRHMQKAVSKTGLLLYFCFLVQIQEKEESEYPAWKAILYEFSKKRLSCSKAVPSPISYACTSIKNGSRTLICIKVSK